MSSSELLRKSPGNLLRNFLHVLEMKSGEELQQRVYKAVLRRSIVNELKKFMQHDPKLQLLTENIEEVVTGNSIISSVLRMICYQRYSYTRTILSQQFPFDLKFVEKSRMISFMEDVIKFGAGSVRKERLFVVGHQGSGKTSLVHSVR